MFLRPQSWTQYPHGISQKQSREGLSFSYHLIKNQSAWPKLMIDCLTSISLSLRDLGIFIYPLTLSIAPKYFYVSSCSKLLSLEGSDAPQSKNFASEMWQQTSVFPTSWVAGGFISKIYSNKCWNGFLGFINANNGFLIQKWMFYSSIRWQIWRRPSILCKNKGVWNSV